MALDDNDTNVKDEAEEIDEEIPYKYAITSYGADYPVESIVQKLEKKAIIIPPFQRDYVWSHVDSSRFIETLLLGLPVPGIFLSKEIESQTFLVIDGQQRLLTLQYFYDGIFRRGPAKDRSFVLKNVQQDYEGKTYKTLDREDKLRLDDSIIHVTIVKQDDPKGDESSVYHIFERLNKYGRQLYPQEIRNCLYHGELNDLLKELNKNESWRTIFGKENPRQKDTELILRFFALLFLSEEYLRPMKDFLNKYMAKNRHLKFNSAEDLKAIFSSTIELIHLSLSEKAFRPEKALNAAVFDAVMVGVARRLGKGAIKETGELKKKYEELLVNDEFKKAYKTSTSDEENVRKRLRLAINLFDSIQ